jgi:PAS domain S-box-containing protein
MAGQILDRSEPLKVEKPAWLEQMEGILETLNEGVLITDDCQRILFANECMEELTGMPRTELVGRTPACFYHGEDLARLNEQRERGRAEGRNRFEHFVPKAGGSVKIPVIASAREIEDPDGRVYAVVTFTDISEQKEAEKGLREANRKLEARAREIEVELALAARVQQSMTPLGLRWGGVAVETYYMPARTIGGDFGVVTALDSGHLHLLVGDVSGHGIGSALVANRIYTETMSLLKSGSKLPHLLHQLNRFVIQQIRTPGFFFTMAAARLEDNGRKLSFEGGGHPPAFLLTARGEMRQLESRNMVLGAFDEAVGKEPAQEIELAAGDRLALYSDGLTEVFNSKDDMLGIEGLGEIMIEAARQPLVEMKQTIIDRVNAFGDGPAQDDMSLVLVEIH